MCFVKTLSLCWGLEESGALRRRQKHLGLIKVVFEKLQWNLLLGMRIIIDIIICVYLYKAYSRSVYLDPLDQGLTFPNLFDMLG